MLFNIHWANIHHMEIKSFRQQNQQHSETSRNWRTWDRILCHPLPGSVAGGTQKYGIMRTLRWGEEILKKNKIGLMDTDSCLWQINICRDRGEGMKFLLQRSHSQKTIPDRIIRSLHHLISVTGTYFGLSAAMPGGQELLCQEKVDFSLSVRYKGNLFAKNWHFISWRPLSSPHLVNWPSAATDTEWVLSSWKTRLLSVQPVLCNKLTPFFRSFT